MVEKTRSFAKDVWPAVLLMLIVVAASADVWHMRSARQRDNTIACGLDRRFPDLRFDGVPLSDVVDFLRNTVGSDIDVDWNELAPVGVTRATSVNGQYKDVRFSKLLTSILRDIGRSPDTLTHYTTERSIVITSRTALEKRIECKTYDVRIVTLNDWNCFGPHNTPPEKWDFHDVMFSETILSFVKDTVDSDHWIESGENGRRMRYHDGFLYVWQIPENHQQIRDLLESLYESRPITPYQLTKLITK